jgi:hypothetical protein
VKIASRHQFWSRDSRGKFPLDLNEIRRAFVASELIVERIRAFRRRRIEDIMEDQTPIHIDAGPVVVVHLVPLDAFDTMQSHDISRVVDKKELLSPMRGGRICPAIQH